MRAKNLAYLRNRYPHQRVCFLDIESPSRVEGTTYDVVRCYGLLHHLRKPGQALAFISESTRGMDFKERKGLLEYVYISLPQPRHEEFQSNWSAPEKHGAGLSRTVFIASRKRLDNPVLTPSVVLQ